MLDRTAYDQLSAQQGDHLVTIYIPTEIVDNKQVNHLRFKNALKDAEAQLQARGMSEDDAEAYLSEAYKMVNNTDLWQHQSVGFAAFISPEGVQTKILPVEVKEHVVVGDSFHLRPMIPVLSNQNRYFVLAISGNEVRFFDANANSITPVKISDLVPASSDEARYNDEHQSTLQHHSGQGGSDQAIFHGQGGAKDQREIDMEVYTRAIDEGLMAMIGDEPNTPPMVVAGAEETAARFINMSSYKNILPTVAKGNPEVLSPSDLHTKTWPIADAYYQKGRDEQKEQFGLYLSEKRASFSPHDIVPKAINGAVERLYLVKGTHTWGAYDYDTNTITVHPKKQPDSVCLQDLAAKHTFQQGGEVYDLTRENMPRPTANLNATYRF